MPGLGALWDSLVDCICRPPRDDYIYPDELVGGSRRLFRVGRYPGIREDLTLTNKRGLLLQCSHYLPKHVRGKDGRLPCVVYCHCNSGSRRDAEEAICVLIPCGVSVFTLDFAGSGLSEGQWVTLGAEEVDDVATAVEYLRTGGRVSTVGLWGRSMGAVTALLYSHRDPSIAGMVLDSPFARLTDLMLEIVQEQRLPIPRPLAKLALAAMKRSVMKRAGFDITKVSPVDAVSQSHIPALFGHATGDTFIRISHAEALHEAYAGEKELIRFDGDHNSRRPEFFYNSVSNFWHRALLLEHLLEPIDLNLSGATPATTTVAGGGVGGSSSMSSSSARAGAGRPLRPPPQRFRHPQAVPALTAGASGAGCGDDDGAGGGACAAAAAGTGTDGTGAAAAEQPPQPPPGAAPVGIGGVGVEEDEGADVAAAHTRSAPWEPRLWELENADKTARERQRFRRMAGGLPSPSGAGETPFGGHSGGSFRSSAELAKLFATSNDESLAARLLGEDAQWSDGLVPQPGPGKMATGTAVVVGGGLAVPPNGRLVKSLMTAALLLPTTEEEEEAQLRAALHLSLVETTAVPPPYMSAAAASASGGAAATAAAATGATATGITPLATATAYQPPLRTHEGQKQLSGQQSLREASRSRSGSGSGNAAGCGPQGGADGAASDSFRFRTAQALTASASAPTSTPSVMRPGGAVLTVARSPSAPPAASAATTAMSPAVSTSAAGLEVTEPALAPPAPAATLWAPSANKASSPKWSNSHERAQLQACLEELPCAALSGPPHLEPLVGKGGGADLSNLLAVADSAATAAAAAATAAEHPEGLKAGRAAAVTAAPAVCSNSKLGSSAQIMTTAAAAVGTTPMGQQVAVAPELTVYDLYTEDELLALAVQLSLQESADGAAAASPALIPGDNSSASMAVSTGAPGLPPLI